MTDQLLAPVLTVIVTCYLIALILLQAPRRRRLSGLPTTGRGPSGDPKPSPPESLRKRLDVRMGIVTDRLERYEQLGWNADTDAIAMGHVDDELARLAMEIQAHETATHGGAW